jgi:hypothetical protein
MMTKEQAFEQVKVKVAELNRALQEMQALHNPRTVGLEEWCEHNADCLFDLHADVFDEVE